MRIFNELQIEAEVARIIATETGLSAENVKRLSDIERVEMRVAIAAAKQVAQRAEAELDATKKLLLQTAEALVALNKQVVVMRTKKTTKEQIDAHADSVFKAVQGYVDRRINARIEEGVRRGQF